MVNTLAAVQAGASIPEEYQLGQFIPLHYHYNMLQDVDRVGAFQLAIAQRVTAGMRVLELGAGTGILSSFAARLGAHVTCVERNLELAATAESLLSANGLGSRVKVCRADASQFIPEQPVDVVICEMLHVAMLREKQLQVIAAFKENYRSAFGESVALPIFIPEASFLMWQPVYQSFDFAGYWAPIPMFQAPQLLNDRTTELGPLDPYASISYESPYAMHFACRQAVTAAADGCANAIRFVTQNVLAIDVPNQSATTWPNQCLVLPLQETLEVQLGDRLQVSLEYAAGAQIDALARSLKLEIA